MKKLFYFAALVAVVPLLFCLAALAYSAKAGCDCSPCVCEPCCCISEVSTQKQKPKVKFVEKGKAFAAGKAVKMKAGDAQPGDFTLLVGTNDDVTIFGDNGTGTPVDISAVAKVTATSSDVTIATIGAANPASPVAYNEKALMVGTSTITITATWNDGSVGPFTATYTLTVSQPPPPAVKGLIITHGTVNVN